MKHCVEQLEAIGFEEKRGKPGIDIGKNIHLIESIGRFSERADTLVFLLFFVYKHNSTCRWVSS